MNNFYSQTTQGGCFFFVLFCFALFLSFEEQESGQVLGFREGEKGEINKVHLGILKSSNE